MKTITNNVPRDWLYIWEIAEKDAEELRSDYDWAFKDDHDPRFFCYRGLWYCEEDFLSTTNTSWNPNPPDWQSGWDGYLADTFFSAVVIRYPLEDWGERDYDHVVVGLVYNG